MSWLLDIRDRDGNDLYPEIRRRARDKNAKEKHDDMVRYDYIEKLGYYCTESSEHNAKYTPYYIKSRYPELIEKLEHTRSKEYASHIMEALTTGIPYKIGGNVINRGIIENLPAEACVEVPCLVDGSGILPCRVGKLPLQLAAMNMTNINVQLLTIEAAVTRKKEPIYHAAMLDPHTAAELSIDDIVKMVDELISAHGNWMPQFL